MDSVLSHWTKVSDLSYRQKREMLKTNMEVPGDWKVTQEGVQVLIQADSQDHPSGSKVPEGAAGIGTKYQYLGIAGAGRWPYLCIRNQGMNLKEL